MYAFYFNKCPIYTLDGANAQFNTDLDETDYSVVTKWIRVYISLHPVLCCCEANRHSYV